MSSYRASQPPAYALTYARQNIEWKLYEARLVPWFTLRARNTLAKSCCTRLNSSVNPLMIKNYFKIAIRSLIRNKFFTTINILGLVLGISFSTMLYIYVRHELSYDDDSLKSE